MRARGGVSRGGTSRFDNASGRGHSNTANNRDSKRIPNRVIHVPLEFQRETLGREVKRLTTSWQTETGCEVVPQPKRDQGKFTISKFELFGTGSNLDKATQQVEQWIRYSVTKTSETTAWAKVPAHIAKNWFQEHTQREQDERKKKFKGDVPEEEKLIHKSLATVEWPQELRDGCISLKDAFGTNLEKLDPIRMDDEVFIKPVGFHQLEIHGSDIIRVRSAEQHIRVLIEKVQKLFENNAVYPRYKLLDGREGLKDGVLYERAETWWPDHSTHPIAPRLLRCVIMSTPGEYWQFIQPVDRYDIQTEIQRALDIARYEKGYYDLSIRVGCLALKKDVSNVGKRLEQENFLNEIINKKELDFIVKNWLADDQGGEQLFMRLIAADHLLEPTAPGTGFSFGNTPRTLAETKRFPTLRGTWVIEDPNASHVISPHYVVRVHWTMDEEDLYEKGHTKFYRLVPGHLTPKENMDIKLLELGESRGWQFGLTSMTPVGKAIVPTALRDFADQVQVKTGYGMSSKECFLDWKISRSVKILAGRLDKVYTFGIRKTGYKVDVVEMWYPKERVPCWGLNVYHNEWRTHLALLEQLRPGECAPWGNTISTFLPDDGFSSSAEWAARDQPSDLDEDSKPLPRDGIRLLLIKLMELSQIIFQSNGAEIPDYPAIPPSSRDPAHGPDSLI